MSREIGDIENDLDSVQEKIDDLEEQLCALCDERLSLELEYESVED